MLYSKLIFRVWADSNGLDTHFSGAILATLSKQQKLYIGKIIIAMVIYKCRGR